MRVALHTFGCKLNQYETEALAQSFRDAGHEVGALASGARLYVVNTCTVTSKSEQKARRLVRALAQAAPSAAVVVTGCYAQTEAEAVSRLAANVVCVPQERKHLLLGLGAALASEAAAAAADLPAVVRDALEERPATPSPFAYAVARTTFHSRATLKIQDGCDYGCAYCRVPLARGGGVSRPAAEVLGEARSLEAGGYREIVLTGINIASYADAGMDLAGLLGALLDATGSARFRLSSLEPERIGGALLEAVGRERVCPHFHLPVQSGSDAVLAAMRRRYGAETVAAAVEALRGAAEDPFIAADFIAGFPGETGADHAASVELVRRVGFAQLHVFPFSPRPGTAAWGMVPRVPERVRGERTEQLRGLSRELHAAYAARWRGREAAALVEDGGRGTTANYLKVGLRGVDAPRGSIVPVRLEAEGDELVGIFSA